MLSSVLAPMFIVWKAKVPFLDSFQMGLYRAWRDTCKELCGTAQHVLLAATSYVSVTYNELRVNQTCDGGDSEGTSVDLSRCPLFQGAYQLQPFVPAHYSTSRYPFVAALAQVPFTLIHFNTSSSPLHKHKSISLFHSKDSYLSFHCSTGGGPFIPR